MSRPVSRDIGRFLRSFLQSEGITCGKYPTIKLLSTPAGEWNFVWNLRQLADCYDITLAYQIEAVNAEVEDETGKYKIDYFSIILRREGAAWGDPIVQTNVEEYPAGLDEKELEERFRRFGRRAIRAILSVVGVK